MLKERQYQTRKVKKVENNLYEDIPQIWTEADG